MIPAPASTLPVAIEWVNCRTPLGDARTTAVALINGQVAVRPVPVLSVGEGEIDRVPLALFEPLAEHVPPRGWKVLEQFVKTVPEAPWGTPLFPVIFASSNFGVGSLLEYGRDGRSEHLPYATPHASMDRIREIKGWGPHFMTVSHACVSGQIALHEATRHLKLGAKQVLVFGYDLLSDFVTGGFHALKILNGQIPAPYMEREIGSIALGDGLAAAVLSCSNRSNWRLAEPHTWNEMFHMTANDPSGAGFDALLGPLATATRGRRVWIKGHGTGTLEAGRLEVEATGRSFGAAPLVSWKGSLGHTLGSCALVELAIAIEAMEMGRIPGTVHGAEPCSPMAPHVAESSFAADPFDGLVLLSNAFGGAHAGALVYHD